MQSLKITIDNLLRRYGIDNAIAQNNALNVWSEVVGKSVANHTEPERVEHGVVIVRVSSATWRQELYLKKKEIVEKINNKIGKNVIRDIRFI